MSTNSSMPPQNKQIPIDIHNGDHRVTPQHEYAERILDDFLHGRERLGGAKIDRSPEGFHITAFSRASG